MGHPVRRVVDQTPLDGVVERILRKTQVGKGALVLEEQPSLNTAVLPPIIGEIDENQVVLNGHLDQHISRLRKSRPRSEFPNDYEIGFANYGDDILVAWLRGSMGQWFPSPHFFEIVRTIEEAVADLYPEARIIHCDNDTKAIYQVSAQNQDSQSQARVEKMMSSIGSLVPNYKESFFPGKENERAYNAAYNAINKAGQIVVLTGNRTWARLLARQVAQEAITLFGKNEVKCFHADNAYDQWQNRWHKAREGEYQKGRIEADYAKQLVVIGTFEFWKNRKGSVKSAEVMERIIDQASRSGSVLIVLDGDYDPECFPETIVKALGYAEFVEVFPPSEETVREVVHSANSSLSAERQLRPEDVEGKILRIVSGMPNPLYNALRMLEHRTGGPLVQALVHPTSQNIEHVTSIVARNCLTTARLLKYKLPGSREDRLEFCMAVFLASELPNVSTDHLAEYFKRSRSQINRILLDMKKAIEWNPAVSERIDFLRKKVQLEPL